MLYGINTGVMLTPISAISVCHIKTIFSLLLSAHTTDLEYNLSPVDGSFWVQVCVLPYHTPDGSHLSGEISRVMDVYVNRYI